MSNIFRSSPCTPCTPATKRKRTAETLTKNTRRRLTWKEKEEILDKISCGEKPADLCEAYGIAASTVSGLKKKRECIIELAKKTPDAKSSKVSTYEKLDEALLTWFSQARSQGIPLNDPILEEMAIVLKDILGGEALNFKGSNGFLWRFKERHNICFKTIQGENLSADSSAVEPFITQLKKEISKGNYSTEQLYNCDETGLLWRGIPNKTLDKNNSKPTGIKTSKTRVTLLLCANAKGSHRIPLAFIHNAAQPMMHCIFTVANIWNQMQQFTLQNSWHNLQIRPSTNTTDTIIELSESLKKCRKTYTDEEIVNWVNQDDA